CSFLCLSCFPWTLSSLFVSAFVVPDSGAWEPAVSIET
ncbi:MAG: hypothetical protein, partial [Olavius algarvensis Gamma 1 endosymbiont]